MKKIIVGILTIQIFASVVFNSGYVKQTNSLLFLNIWYYSSQDSLIQVLKSLDLDIMALSEISNERLFHLAGALDFPFASPFMTSNMDSFRVTHRGIISKYPVKILNDFAAQISMPQTDIIVYVVHLNSKPYLPYYINDGKYKHASEVEKVAKESKGAEIESHIMSLDTLKELNLPIFLVGDFNEPSYLDWVEENEHWHQGMVVKWPTHQAVHKAGFTDAYREIFPDPLSKPGNTWSPLFPETPQDRIDFIYYHGKVQMNGLGLIGKYDSLADFSWPVYPSDHRGIYANFNLRKNE